MAARRDTPNSAARAAKDWPPRPTRLSDVLPRPFGEYGAFVDLVASVGEAPHVAVAVGAA